MTRDDLAVGPRPQALTEILDAAEKLLAKIEARIRRPVRPSGRLKSTEEVMLSSARLMQTYLGYIEELSYDINDLNFVLYYVPKEERDIGAAMARIEAQVYRVLARQRQIRSWRATALGAEGRDILDAIFGHLLGEVRGWLQNIVATLRDPIDALERQGVRIETGVAKLKVRIHFATPPQMGALERWAERCRERRD